MGFGFACFFLLGFDLHKHSGRGRLMEGRRLTCDRSKSSSRSKDILEQHLITRAHAVALAPRHRPTIFTVTVIPTWFAPEWCWAALRFW